MVNVTENCLINSAYLQSKTLWICRFSPTSSPQLFQNNGEFGAIIYFSNHRIANNNNFSGLFFELSRTEGEFPGDYFVNAAIS